MLSHIYAVILFALYALCYKKLFGYQNLFLSSWQFQCYENQSWNLVSEKFIFKHKQSNSRPIFSLLSWINENHYWYFLSRYLLKSMNRFAWSAAEKMLQGTFLNIYIKTLLICILLKCYVVLGQMWLTFVGCWKWCLERMRSTSYKVG